MAIPGFRNNPQKIVHRVDTDPALIKLTTQKELMRTATELLYRYLKNFLYNRKLTANHFGDPAT